MLFLLSLTQKKITLKIFIGKNRCSLLILRNKLSYFATTESDKLFPPLKDRLTTIDFEPYEYSELGEILQTKVPDVNFTPDALYQIAKTTRGNARNAVMRAKEIMLFCEAENSPTFNGVSFQKFCDTLGILPHGITCTENSCYKY